VGLDGPVPGGREGGLIAGHGRVLAAKQLGLDEVPVVVARGWSAAQKRAYVIADNKLTENGGWDDDLLAGDHCPSQ
jgi:ParB-like chromosome segregation protein Spo0J